MDLRPDDNSIFSSRMNLSERISGVIMSHRHYNMKIVSLIYLAFKQIGGVHFRSVTYFLGVQDLSVISLWQGVKNHPPFSMSHGFMDGPKMHQWQKLHIMKNFLDEELNRAPSSDYFGHLSKKYRYSRWGPEFTQSTKVCRHCTSVLKALSRNSNFWSSGSFKQKK